MTALFCRYNFFFFSAVKHFCPLSNRAGCILFELTSKQLGTSRFIQQDASYIAMQRTCKCRWEDVRACACETQKALEGWSEGADGGEGEVRVKLR